MSEQLACQSSHLCGAEHPFGGLSEESLNVGVVGAVKVGGLAEKLLLTFGVERVVGGGGGGGAVATGQVVGEEGGLKGY